MVDLGLSGFRHQQYPDHPLRGTLWLESSKRVISHRLTDTYAIISGTIPEFDVIILDVGIQDTAYRAAFMAFNYESFIVEQGEPTPRKEALAASMLGLLFNTIDYTRIIMDNNELVGFCINAGFRPIFRIISREEEIMFIATHRITQKFLGRFGAGTQVYLHNRDQHLVMLGPILLTIGKNIQVSGYNGWITRRVRAFMGTLGLENYNIIWTESTYPTIEAMNTIGSFLSASFHLRREIFRICWAVASLQGRLANIFKDVISLLKGTSMTHIILIDEYLYSRYRELLSIRLLADNHKGMLAAWQFLASLQPHEVYYAKILFDKEQTACLNRNNFPLHTAAAVAAAKFETPSMINYRGTEGQIQSSTLLGTIVENYLKIRLRGAPFALINDWARFGSPLEAIEFHKQVEQGRDDGDATIPSTQQRGQPVQLPGVPQRD